MIRSYIPFSKRAYSGVLKLHYLKKFLLGKPPDLIFLQTTYRERTILAYISFLFCTDMDTYNTLSSFSLHFYICAHAFPVQLSTACTPNLTVKREAFTSLQKLSTSLLLGLQFSTVMSSRGQPLHDVSVRKYILLFNDQSISFGHYS